MADAGLDALSSRRGRGTIPLAMVALTIVAGLGAAPGPGARAQQAPPTFRAATEAVVIDASVLDRNRHPVRGLTAVDFTILEDGQPQAIRTFQEVDLGGDGSVPEPVWAAQHKPDARRNAEVREHSLVVILLDASTPMDARDVLYTKQVAERAIDQLRPGDLAAVVHTMNKPAGQDFTQDRELLRASVRRFSGTVTGGSANTLYQITLSALEGVAKILATLPGQRKAVLFISPGLPLDPSRIGPQGFGVSNEAGAEQESWLRDLLEILQTAQRANVSFYGIDPAGLRAVPNPLQLAFLRGISEDTGGFPVINTNDQARPIAQIYDETRHYYLIGYQPTNPRTDGTFRKVEVRVNRPDVTVRTRKGYYAPRKAAVAKASAVSSEVTAALQGAVPLADLPLEMTAVSFPAPSGKRADVAIAVEASEVVPPGAATAATDVEVAVHAYDPGWRLRGSASFSPRFGFPAGQDVRYGMLWRLGLDPGRYQLRVAVQSSLAGRRGSVYYDLTVPDFRKQELAASGVVLDVRPVVASAPEGALASFLPFAPTARRAFDVGDQVTALVRISQRDRKERLPVRITARILDREGAVAWSSAQEMGREQFTTGMADYRVELPVSTLARGPHLLEISAADGRSTARSELRFERR